MNPKLGSLAITIGFSVLVLALSPAYWFLSALGSMGGGPGDDIVIVYILVLPILVHGFLVGCYGYRHAAISSLVFFGVVAFLCVVRHFEISDRMGYSQWHARRSLEALAWSIPWFIGAGCFSLLRKTKSTGEQAGDGDTGKPSDPIGR